MKVEHFKLLARLKFAISNFFVACGLGKRGDEFVLDFDQCIGKMGTCKVLQQVGNDSKLYSQIDEFYDPRIAPKAAMNDNLPFMEQQPQPQQQANYGYGY
jgi:hypothetical protein